MRSLLRAAERIISIVTPRLLVVLGEDVELATLVVRLFAMDHRVAVRAAALAGRLRFAHEHPESEQRRIESWPIELAQESVAVRRGLDAAEEGVVCPCDAHGRIAHEWAQFHGQGAERRATPYLAFWAAGLAGEATGRPNPLPYADGEANCDRAIVTAVRRQLASWLAGGSDPIRQDAWLPSDRRKLRPFPECPPIDWRCQECRAFVRRTDALFPDESEDSDCLDHPDRNCSAGYSMNMVSTCSICGHDLGWGADPCPHFAK